MYLVFLSSYRNTRESLGELEKAVETLACGSCSHSISRFKLPPVFLFNNTVHVFYFLKTNFKTRRLGMVFFSCRTMEGGLVSF